MGGEGGIWGVGCGEVGRWGGGEVGCGVGDVGLGSHQAMWGSGVPAGFDGVGFDGGSRQEMGARGGRNQIGAGDGAAGMGGGCQLMGVGGDVGLGSQQEMGAGR